MVQHIKSDRKAIAISLEFYLDTKRSCPQYANDTGYLNLLRIGEHGVFLSPENDEIGYWTQRRLARWEMMRWLPSRYKSKRHRCHGIGMTKGSEDGFIQ
jgi:hypothetical protein